MSELELSPNRDYMLAACAVGFYVWCTPHLGE